ncbi:MAG: hypothetical protein LBE82_06230, partial [Chitinophagaceae bacterium]|nr:hypothetical protein [Chitinophagaceae bacterium]
MKTVLKIFTLSFLVISFSCKTHKTLTSSQSNVDSSFYEHHTETTVNKKDSFAALLTSNNRSTNTYQKNNLIIFFNPKDTAQSKEPIQVWTDSAGKTNINTGGRKVDAVIQSTTREKSKNKNNSSATINATKA